MANGEDLPAGVLRDILINIARFRIAVNDRLLEIAGPVEIREELNNNTAMFVWDSNGSCRVYCTKVLNVHMSVPGLNNFTSNYSYPLEHDFSRRN